MYFAYSKAQRSGLFLLFAIIISLQFFYYLTDFTKPEINSPEKEKWLSLQTEIDSLKQEKENFVPKIYPFNPNFINDFKGYKLGMSTTEIDRLLAFREKNLYVNSAEDFQKVTLVSDSLLKAIAPYFKFPDWAKNKKMTNFKPFPKTTFEKKEKIVVLDINEATQDDLIKIYGIGPALSERILKEKEKFGAFVAMEQMNDIWGLSPEVIESLNKYFKIVTQPKVMKVKINDASVKELMKFPYFKYPLAKQIVTYRSMNGGIHNSEDLIKINGFPVEKLKIIALYLEF